MNRFKKNINSIKNTGHPKYRNPSISNNSSKPNVQQKQVYGTTTESSHYLLLTIQRQTKKYDIIENQNIALILLPLVPILTKQETKNSDQYLQII